MNIILQAAYTELDLLHMELESVERMLKDVSQPAIFLAGADIRKAAIEQGVALVAGIIADQLGKESITDVMNDINHNLSDKCN